VAGESALASRRPEGSQRHSHSTLASTVSTVAFAETPSREAPQGRPTIEDGPGPIVQPEHATVSLSATARALRTDQ
jgi:hypothetical protein